MPRQDIGDNEADLEDERRRSQSLVTGRGITLSMLMADGCIKAGKKVLSIDYLVNL